MHDERASIRAYLVCGFLGAGKTTFILDHLKTVGSNVAVLVNEFGKLGIDSAIIESRGGIDVVEMPGGCICCSQRQGLVASINERVLRAKGFLEVAGYGCVSVQVTPGQVSVEITGRSCSPRLTIIGFGLKEKAILRYFEHVTV